MEGLEDPKTTCLTSFEGSLVMGGLFWISLVPATLSHFCKRDRDLTPKKDAQWNQTWRSFIHSTTVVTLMVMKAHIVKVGLLTAIYMAVDLAGSISEPGGLRRLDNYLHHMVTFCLVWVALAFESISCAAEHFAAIFLASEGSVIFLNLNHFVKLLGWGGGYLDMITDAVHVLLFIFLRLVVMTAFLVSAGWGDNDKWSGMPFPVRGAFYVLALLQWVWYIIMFGKSVLGKVEEKQD